MNKSNLISEEKEIIYISDAQTFELLYLNPVAKKFFKHSCNIGEKCFTALYGLSKQCEFCNLNLIKDGYSYICCRNGYLVYSKIISNAHLECAFIAPTEKEMYGYDKIFALFGTVLKDYNGGWRLQYKFQDILNIVAKYYNAKFVWLYTFDNGMPYTKSNNKLELTLNSDDVNIWQKQFGFNRAVFIPDNEGVASLLGGSFKNALAMLKGNNDKPDCMIILGELIETEKSFDCLEIGVDLISMEQKFDDAYLKKHQIAAKPATNKEHYDYYNALLTACEFICDVDVVDDTYTIVNNRNGEICSRQPKNGYNAQVKFRADNYVHADDRNMFLNSMELFNICNSNLQKNELLFREKNKDEIYHWKKYIINHINENYNKRESVIIISFDADAQKLEEQLNINSHLKDQEIKYRREIHRKDEIYRIIGEQTKVGAFEWSKNIDGFQTTYISNELAEEFQFFRRDIHLFNYLLITKSIYHADMEQYCKFLDDETEGTKTIVCRVTKDGFDYHWYQFTKRNSVNRMIGTVLNVDDETRASYALKRRARFDSLTGLLNQEAFYTEAEKLMASNTEKEYAVIIMDIDNFKLVNSLYGMNVGNQVLVQIGQTLQSCLEKNDICARVYADVFYMVTPYHNDELLVSLVQKIMERLTYVEYGTMLLPCFGISNSKASQRSITLLCELAGFAHKFGKGHTRKRYTFYDVSIRQTIIEEKQMESEMEFALYNGQFKMYLQPKYVIGTGEVVGAEALVRWEHPTKGMIVPAKFISLFEKNGFILRLDEYMWEQVCILLQKWQTSGQKCIPISVNMSRLHLTNRDFISTIVNMLEKYHISHKWFELELTENLVFDNLNQMITVLSDLRHRGFYINMDDFGSGYSSLNMLRNIPIDVLKIDGNFFDEKMLTPKGKTIVKYVVSMAKELDMKVVAEAVENKSQEKFLIEIGCEIAQGFYFSRPLPVADFESRYWQAQ